MSNIPRMIPIKTAATESGLSYDAIRKLCLKKEIRFIRSGTKYLINADSFAAYLNGESEHRENVDANH